MSRLIDISSELVGRLMIFELFLGISRFDLWNALFSALS